MRQKSRTPQTARDQSVPSVLNFDRCSASMRFSLQQVRSRSSTGGTRRCALLREAPAVVRRGRPAHVPAAGRCLEPRFLHGSRRERPGDLKQQTAVSAPSSLLTPTSWVHRQARLGTRFCFSLRSSPKTIKRGVTRSNQEATCSPFAWEDSVSRARGRRGRSRMQGHVAYFRGARRACVARGASHLGAAAPSPSSWVRLGPPCLRTQSAAERVRFHRAVFGLVPMGRAQGLNQTYGWGTESGDSFGSGTVHHPPILPSASFAVGGIAHPVAWARDACRASMDATRARQALLAAQARAARHELHGLSTGCQDVDTSLG